GPTKPGNRARLRLRSGANSDSAQRREMRAVVSHPGGGCSRSERLFFCARGGAAAAGVYEHSMETLAWAGDRLRLLDQTRLPLEEVYVELSDYRDVAEAIRTLRVRGAPALGVAA